MLDHHPAQVVGADLGRPAELLSGLARVAEQDVDLGGPHVALVELDEVVVVEVEHAEGPLEELADRVGLARGDDVVVGLRPAGASATSP